jgi:hypothetical protein
MGIETERRLAKIQRDVIARGVFTSVADLSRKLMKYIQIQQIRRHGYSNHERDSSHLVGTP